MNINITVSTNELYVKGGKSGVEIVTFTSTEPIQVTYEQITNGLNGYTRVSIVDNFTTNVTWKIEYSGLNVHNEIYKGEIYARLTGSDEDLVVPVTIDCSVPSTNRIETTCKTLYVKGEKNGTETVVFTCAEPIEVTYEQFTNNLNGNVRVWIENNFTNEVTWNVEYSDLYLYGETYSGLIHARLSGDVDSLDVPVVINCSDTLIYVDINKGEESIEFSFSSLPEINSLYLIGDNILNIYSHSDKYNIKNELLGNYKYLTAANGLSQISIDLDDYKPQELPFPPLPPLEGFSNEIYRFSGDGVKPIYIAEKSNTFVSYYNGTTVGPRHDFNYDVVDIEAIDAYTMETVEVFHKRIYPWTSDDYFHPVGTVYERGIEMWCCDSIYPYRDLRLKITPKYKSTSSTNKTTLSPYGMLFRYSSLKEVIGDIDLPPISTRWWNTETVRYPSDKSYHLYSMFGYSNIETAPVVKIHDNEVNDKSILYAGLFEFCHKLTDIENTRGLIDSNVTNISRLFAFCNKITDLSPLANWDTSNVTDMSGLFRECYKITDLSPLANWDTSNVTDMTQMFDGCSSLTSIPLLDTSNVTDMTQMFDGCSSLTSIPLLDTSNVTDMFNMFAYCSSLTSIPLLDTSKVTNMTQMFYDCPSLTSIPLLDTSNVTDTFYMFAYCSSLTTIPQIDTSKVTNMDNMFYKCSSLTTIPQIDTSKVTNMGGMFYNCSSLTSIPLLDTSNVIRVVYMFDGCSSLTNIGGFKNLKVSLDLSGSPLLTHESLMNVINNLVVDSFSPTLSLGTTNLAKLTNEEKMIAINKGWVLS